jgi:hypothetical protein
MFQTLLADIRAGVIGRIFLYQPRGAAAQVETVADSSAVPAAAATVSTQSADKKRKRHRH